MELRDYQENAINDSRKLFSTGEKRCILAAPTGAGKSIIMIQIIINARKKDKKVLIIIDSIALINQFSRHLDNFGIDHGIHQADHPRRKDWEPVQVASIHTLAKRDCIGKFDIILVDECHVHYAKTDDLLDSHNGVALGFTATPYQASGKRVWHNLIKVSTISELTEIGFLVPYTLYAPEPPDLSKVKIDSTGDYNKKQLLEKVDKPKIVGDVVKNWLKNGEDRLTICFGVNIAHSKHLCEEFNKYGVLAKHIDSFDDSDTCKAVIEEFENKQIKVLCSVGKLIKGFDVPHIGALIDAAPTKSVMRFIQKVGRGLRKSNDYKDVLIFDHAGNFARLGYPESISCDELLDETEYKSEKIKRDKPLPKPCPSCGRDSGGIFPCPFCGFKPERKNSIEHADGNLEKIENVDTFEKERWYGMLLHYAKTRGFANGWADHKYKEKFKAWPKTKNVQTEPPDQEVMNFIKHLNIKRAKSKPTRCKYCGSNNLRVADAGPKKQLRCGKCHKHLMWLK